MNAAEPAWLLLAWGGLAATLAAALTGAAPGISSLFPPAAGVPARRLRTVTIIAITGVIAYPFLYGASFELFGRADLGVGAGLGAVHGLLALLVRGLRRRPAEAPALSRVLLGRLLYGAVIGLVYVVPTSLGA